MIRIAIALLLSVGLVLSGNARGDYPDKPVRIVVPFAPGSGADTLMRLMAQQLTERLSQAFVVENRAGAGGNIGLQFVAGAPPDGYTLVLASPSTVINPLLGKNAGYALSQFEPVAGWARTPLILLANPATGITSLKSLLDRARSAPGKLNYGSGGVGLPQFMLMELLKQREKLDIVHVPFRGSAPAMQALLANDVNVAADTIVLALPQVQAGKLHALAITTPERSPLAPNIPTVAELGYPALETSAFIAVLAPAKTPPAVIEKLNATITAALRDPDTIKRIREIGAEPFPASRKELSDYLTAETARWAAVIRDQNIKVEE